MDPRMEALEAAKLAAMVSSQLKKVDQLTVERSSLPANKINIQEFINSVQDPNFRTQNKFSQVPSGFAPPPPEDLVRRMVPDAPQVMPQILPDIPQPQQIVQPQQIIKLETKTAKKEQSSESVIKLEKNIEKHLKNISKTLENMLKLLEEKYKNEQ
jgi:hypothetical protein